MKKTLISLQGLLFLTSIVFAEIPTNKEDLLKTTLAELNKQDATTYPNKSSYQLEEATDTTGNFVITKYWDDNGTITPVNYNVKFTDVLGDENGGRTYRYDWQIVDEKRTLVKVTTGISDITAKVNTSDNKRIDTDQQGGDVLHSFIGITNISTEDLQGGAIYNTTEIGTINGDFIANYVSSSAYAYGGVIYNGSSSAKINSIMGNFIGNYASDYGGAIYNSYGTIDSITGDFIGNYVSGSGCGGAICNSYGTIDSITGNFIGNHAFYGGAIYNRGTIGSITGNFIGNHASYGSAIYNNGGSITFREGTSFTGNYIAIYNYSSEASIINFNVYDTSKSIVVNDGINGDAKYKTFQILNINQVSDAGVYGTVEFNSFVNNQTVNVYNGILKLGSFAGATLDVNGTELIVPETKASLTNTNINVSSGAKVIIDTAVNVAGGSEFYLEAGAILAINSGSSLSVDSESYFGLENGAKLEINLGSIVGDFELNLIQVNDATALADLLATLKSEDTTSVFSNEQKVYGWTLYQGTGDYSSWIVLAGTVAVPEPAEWAVIFGAVALGFAYYRKRK